jgi:hypothetical protein
MPGVTVVTKMAGTAAPTFPRIVAAVNGPYHKTDFFPRERGKVGKGEK